MCSCAGTEGTVVVVPGGGVVLVAGGADVVVTGGAVVVAGGMVVAGVRVVGVAVDAVVFGGAAVVVAVSGCAVGVIAEPGRGDGSVTEGVSGAAPTGSRTMLEDVAGVGADAVPRSVTGCRVDVGGGVAAGTLEDTAVAPPHAAATLARPRR